MADINKNIEALAGEEINQVNAENTKDNTDNDRSAKPKVTTGGYSELYGGGYCEGSYVAPEIRDAANCISEEMKKQAKELGVELKQRSGYLNFGAGIQIHMPDYVITVPTAFEWKCGMNGHDITAYSRDCADDIDTSPLLLELDRIKLMKPITHQELLIRQQNATELIGGTLETAPLDYSEAIIVTDKQSDERLVKRVFVLVNDGFEIFSLKLTFLRKIDNIDEITKRVYYSLFMIKKPAEEQAEKPAEVQSEKQAEAQSKEQAEEQAEELGIELKKKTVRLNFGAGIQIHMPDYVITVPDAFEWKCGMNGRDFTAYSAGCAADIDASPLVIELARTRLMNPFTEEEFFIRQKNAAQLLGGTIETAQLDFAKAIIVTFRMSDERLVKRVFVLVNNGYEMFSLQLTFLGEVDNTDEIAKRIYYSLYISQTEKNRTGKNKNGNTDT